MNKQEAAKFIGCSVRALERYTQQGRVAVKYVRGKTSPIVAYDLEELERLKEELTAVVYKPAITQNVEHKQDALANVQSNQHYQLLGLERFSELLETFIQCQCQKNTKMLPQHKMLLTLTEARAFTGLSRNILKDAVASNQLKAALVGRAWRVKKADLEKYVEKLF